MMSGRPSFRQKINLPLKIGVRDIKTDVTGTVAGKVEVLSSR